MFSTMSMSLDDASPDVQGFLRYFSLSHRLDGARLLWLRTKYGVWWETITKVSMLKAGDHICTPLVLPTHHHAIVTRVINDKKVEVIQLSRPPGGSSGLPLTDTSTIKVRRDQEDFSKLASEGSLYRITYRACSSSDEVIARAESQMGKPGLGHRPYNIATNNCEHFATWCKTGEAFCTQSMYVHHGEHDDSMLPF